MLYAIYWKERNEYPDTITVKGAKLKDLYIQNLKKLDFDYIAFCRIYKSGEYGKRQFIRRTSNV